MGILHCFVFRKLCYLDGKISQNGQAQREPFFTCNEKYFLAAKCNVICICFDKTKLHWPNSYHYGKFFLVLCKDMIICKKAAYDAICNHKQILWKHLVSYLKKLP